MLQSLSIEVWHKQSRPVIEIMQPILFPTMITIVKISSGLQAIFLFPYFLNKIGPHY